MEERLMMTIKELEKAYAEGREDVIANMTMEEVEKHIMALVNAYYISYLNNDEKEHKSILKTLDLITDEYKSHAYFSDMDEDEINNYINYCMILSINGLLNDLMERDFNLRVPEAVAINTAGNEETVMERMERNQKYIADFIMRRLKHGDCLMAMIRDDIELETIYDHEAILKSIFNENGINGINEYLILNGGNEL